MDSSSFVAGLVKEMHDLFAGLESGAILEAESEGRVEIVTLLELALGSELEAASIAAVWLPSTPEIDAKTVFAEQVADEMRHYNLIVRRLEELGRDLTGFDPMARGYSPLYQYLQSLRTTPQRMAAGPFTCEAVAEARNVQFIELCQSAGDLETARLYEEIIQPDEIRHHHRSREILERLATTPAIQAEVTTAMRSSLAIADELRALAGKTSGLPNIPVS